MADLVITKLDFPSALKSQTQQIGVAVTTYQLLRLDSATKKYVLADATALENAEVAYIALMDGDIDQYIAMLPLNGNINVTLSAGNLVVNTDYVVSATPGAIAEEGDLTTGQFKSKVGSGISATQMKLRADITGLAMP
jgi:hypothetical protein